MDKENKKRGPNFNSTELELLKKLCTKYFTIIECKKSDSVSWKVKDSQWEQIASEFNSQNTIYRCSKVLRKKWENIKKLLKDKVAGHRRHHMGTGGGPPLPELKLNKWETEILNLIQISAVGLPPEFDDDAVTQPGPAVCEDNINTPEFTWEDESSITQYVELQTEHNYVSHERNQKEPKKPEEREKHQENNTWTSYNPDSLRTPKSDYLELRRYRKRPCTGTMTNKAWLELAEEKKAVAKLKAQKLKKDCELQDALIMESKLRSEELKLKIEILKQQGQEKLHLI